MIAHEADPDGPEDRAVSVPGVERALLGRRIRRLRNRLGMTQEAFANAYGIPLADIVSMKSAGPCRRQPYEPI